MDSFYFEDIRLVMRALRAGNGGLAPRFLGGTTQRIDCTDRAFVAGACTASTHPRARWPSGHDMTLMQQLAVDLATNTLTEGGLFSVNGPPGTGKTTLLMDLVAAVVLRRAEAMCAFRHPAEAFERDKWQTWSWSVHGLHSSLRDHLIVVASTNNAAVENVTKELPAAKKVDRRYVDALGFFVPTADALLARPPDEDEPEEDEDEGRRGGRGPGRGCAGLGADLGRLGQEGQLRALCGYPRPLRAQGPGQGPAFGLQPVPPSCGDATHGGLADRGSSLSSAHWRKSRRCEPNCRLPSVMTARRCRQKSRSWSRKLAAYAAELLEANRGIAAIEAELVDSRAAFERADKGSILSGKRSLPSGAACSGRPPRPGGRRNSPLPRRCGPTRTGVSGRRRLPAQRAPEPR